MTFYSYFNVIARGRYYVAKKMAGINSGRFYDMEKGLHHSRHSSAHGRYCRFILFLFNQNTFGGQEHAGDVFYTVNGKRSK